MSLPNRLEAYPDCIEVLDRAAATPGGVRVMFKDYGEAGLFGMRLNQARYLQREKLKRLYEPNDPRWGSSEHDKLMIRKPRQDADENWWIYIEPAGATILCIEPIEESQHAPATADLD
jgi:hypothetical protein